MTDWHPEPDQLVALALAEPDAAEQERLVVHLAGCPACRDEYAQLSDGLQQALAATPAIAPPAGFSGRVLTAMGGPAPAAPPRARGRLLLVAALLVGVLLGAGSAGRHRLVQPSTRGSAARHGGRAVDHRRRHPDRPGLGRRDGRDYLLLNVTAAAEGAHYECILVGADGSRVSGGSWTLSDEYGRGTASGAWLVPLTGTPPTLGGVGGTVREGVGEGHACRTTRWSSVSVPLRVRGFNTLNQRCLR